MCLAPSVRSLQFHLTIPLFFVSCQIEANRENSIAAAISIVTSLLHGQASYGQTALCEGFPKTHYLCPMCSLSPQSLTYLH